MLSIPHLSRTTERRRGAASGVNAPAVASPRDQHPLLLAPLQSPVALALEPSSNQLAVLPVTSSSVTPLTRRLRKVRRKSKNCRNLSRYGHEYSGFRHTTTRETMIHADLEDVYHQIWELEQKRILMQSIQLVRHANAAGLVADKVRDYYSHFRRGYDPTKCTDGGQFLQSLLRSIMLDDVKSSAFNDLDTFLFQWENYSRYHSKVLLEVDSIQPLESEDPTEYIVKVEGLSTLTISRDTIKHFFKPMMEDEAMVQQLIGKEYIFPFVTMFYFNLDGRIFKMEPRADLAAGLFNLVSDPFSTVKLLGASKLTDDGCLHAYNDPETPEFEVISSSEKCTTVSTTE